MKLMKEFFIFLDWFKKDGWHTSSNTIPTKKRQPLPVIVNFCNHPGNDFHICSAIFLRSDISVFSILRAYLIARKNILNSIQQNRFVMWTDSIPWCHDNHYIHYSHELRIKFSALCNLLRVLKPTQISGNKNLCSAESRRKLYFKKIGKNVI